MNYSMYVVLSAVTLQVIHERMGILILFMTDHEPTYCFTVYLKVSENMSSSIQLCCFCEK